MEMLDHPNIVNLTEVIDDPNADRLYLGIYCSITSDTHPILNYLPSGAKKYSALFFCARACARMCAGAVLEYVEGKCTCEDSGPPGGIGEMTARRYFRDIVSGLMYLHAHVRCSWW